MQKRSRLLALAAGLVTIAAGCGFQHSSTPTAPTASGSGGSSASTSYIGTWTSTSTTAATAPDVRGCGNFQWTIDSQTSTQISGRFVATCLDGIGISGQGTGQLTGAKTASVSVTGSASMPGVSSCQYALTGNGTLIDSNTISIAFTGTSCMGPFSGTETLRRKQPAAPTPDPLPPAPAPPAPAPPAPEPTPPAPSVEPWEECGALAGDKLRLVECVHGFIRPTDTESAFEVTKRVAWLLRGEGGGLMQKAGGENVVSWAGYGFAASRMCFVTPDRPYFKIISDAGPGGRNGPTWNYEGVYDPPSQCVAAIDPRK